jgi:hypothetical protein
MKDFDIRYEYPFGYIDKPVDRRRHPSGFKEDYNYE